MQIVVEKSQATKADLEQCIKSRVDNKPFLPLTDSIKATGGRKAWFPFESMAMSSVSSAAPVTPVNGIRKGPRIVAPSSQLRQARLETNTSNELSNKKLTVADRPKKNYMKQTKPSRKKIVGGPSKLG